MDNNRIDVDLVQRLTETFLYTTAADIDAAIFRVIMAFDVPHLVYNSTRKSFVKYKGTASLFGTADDKANLFRERLELINQRLQVRPCFPS